VESEVTVTQGSADSINLRSGMYRAQNRCETKLKIHTLNHAPSLSGRVRHSDHLVRSGMCVGDLNHYLGFHGTQEAVGHLTDSNFHPARYILASLGSLVIGRSIHNASILSSSCDPQTKRAVATWQSYSEALPRTAFSSTVFLLRYQALFYCNPIIYCNLRDSFLD
jgi:hypothetical protein